MSASRAICTITAPCVTPTHTPGQTPAPIADGDHARTDAYVSLAVIASATAIAAGAPILDPIIGLAMTAVILRITRVSWLIVRGRSHH